MKRRCRLARTSPEGREKPDPKLEWPGDSDVYPGKTDSEGGERGEGKRSSSRRSLSPFLKAMVGKAAYKSNYGEKAASVSTDIDLLTRVSAQSFLRPRRPDQNQLQSTIKLATQRGTPQAAVVAGQGLGHCAACGGGLAVWFLDRRPPK